jgi:iron(III) transport system permease protein
MGLRNGAYIKAGNVSRPALLRKATGDLRRLLPARRSIIRRIKSAGNPTTLILVAAAMLVTSLILLIPVYLLVRSIGAGQEALSSFMSLRTVQLLGNTVLLAAAVAFGATLLAVPLAWLTAATDLPGRRLWAILAALPLIFPSYVAAFIYVSTLSPKGLLQQLLNPLIGLERLPDFYGFSGAFFVLTLITYPYILLTVRGAFRHLDPSLVEAARNLGLTPWQAFWRVTLPHLRPAITAGVLLVALYVFRDFGAVTTLQYNTFTRIIYNRYLSYRLEMAALFASILVILTTVVLLLEQRSRGRSRYDRLSIGCSRRPQLTSLGRWKVPALIYVAAIVTVALVVPLATLLYWLWRGWQNQQSAAGPGTIDGNLASLTGLIEPAWHTVSASFLAAFLTVMLALPVAILVVRRPGRLSRMFERVAYAGFALPGIVVALALVFFGINVFPSLYQTLPMLLAAYVILFIPQAIGAERASLLQLSPSLEEAGRSLGQHPFSVLRRITLPLIRPGLVGGALLVFLTAMKELPATLILSPLGFSTLAAQVWTNIGEAFFARAAMPTLLLLLLSSIPLAWLTLRDSHKR